MNNNTNKEHILVAWNDTDVPVLIKDKAFAGKLAPAKSTAKENQPEGGLLLKKKRVSKKLSILPTQESKEELAYLNLIHQSQSLNEAELNELRQNRLANEFQKLEFSKISNHFVFGNQNSSASDALMNKTSNNKLDQSLRVSYPEMCEILKGYKPFENSSIELLNEHYEKIYFPEWFKQMNFGFNILLHGVGSKKCLIEKFCEKYLQNDYYLILLGYHHDFNTKNLLKNIISDVLELNEVYKTVDEQLNAIHQNLDNNLFLIIHNIDGNCLRDPSIQYCLSELASNKYVHMMASVDHINSSILWDNMQYVSFKWVHYEVSTLMPYNDEIMFENSLMLNQTGNVQLSSMIHIFKSLTQNAKNIFLIMVQAVLNPSNAKKNITFTKLYHECRERFFVSNELTLRAQLTEFIDHKLIKIKTESDGYETIYLLIDEKNLKLYLEDLKDKV